MEAPIIVPTENVADYISRNNFREVKLCIATMSQIQYFVDNGDDRATAKSKVSQISSEVALWIYPYVLGNMSPLLNAINNSKLEFMDANAKTFLINNLTVN